MKWLLLGPLEAASSGFLLLHPPGITAPLGGLEGKESWQLGPGLGHWLGQNR